LNVIFQLGSKTTRVWSYLYTNCILCFVVKNTLLKFVQALYMHPEYGASWHRLRRVNMQKSALWWQLFAIEKRRNN